MEVSAGLETRAAADLEIGATSAAPRFSAGCEVVPFKPRTRAELA